MAFVHNQLNRLDSPFSFGIVAIPYTNQIVTIFARSFWVPGLPGMTFRFVCIASLTQSLKHVSGTLDIQPAPVEDMGLPREIGLNPALEILMRKEANAVE